MLSTDPYQRLLEKARKATELMHVSGKSPVEYRGDDGTAIQGWLIMEFGEYRNEEQHGPYNFEESWGMKSLLLTTDGDLYIHGFSGRSDSSGTTLTSGLHQCKPQDLIGNNGKPLNEVAQILERLR